MKSVLVLGLILLGSASARATFYSYSEWEALPVDAQATYAAGAFDAYVLTAMGVGAPGASGTATRFYACLKSSRLTQAQFSANIRSFASTRPQFHGGAFPAAMIAYLQALCPK